jgi:hypothetical protein
MSADSVPSSKTNIISLRSAGTIDGLVIILSKYISNTWASNYSLVSKISVNRVKMNCHITVPDLPIGSIG